MNEGEVIRVRIEGWASSEIFPPREPGFNKMTAIMKHPTLKGKAPLSLRHYGRAADEKIDWVGSTGFFLVHVAGFSAFFTGVSWPALAMCFFMYYARMFAVTGGYHRYFAHRSYKTSRFFQF